MLPQPERAGVFERVQLPQYQPGRQPLLRDLRANDRTPYGAADGHSLRQHSRNDSLGDNRNTGRYYDQEPESFQSRYKNKSNRYPTHSDRIIRCRDIKPRGGRYGGSRYGSGPYDRKGELTWREKAKPKQDIQIRSPVQVRNEREVNRGVVSFEQPLSSTNNLVLEDQSHRTRDDERSGGERSKK
ncbi:hypothetical protein Bca4012_037417 [Brassica carinata]